MRIRNASARKLGYTQASQLASRNAANDNYNWPGGANIARAYVANGRNQYTSVAGVAFGHDARGNLSSDGARTFSYDFENRLVSASGPTAASFVYDPLGRMFQVGTASTTTQFLYDGDRLSAEYNGTSATPLRRYVHGPGVDEPLVWYEGAGTADRRYLIADHQGSIIAENGAATTRYSYGPYGEPNSWTGSRFRYTGQIALPEANLYHYKARVYDPMLGRFLQTDPVGYEDDLNLYAYVRSDPLNNVDPTGRCPACINTVNRIRSLFGLPPIAPGAGVSGLQRSPSSTPPRESTTAERASNVVSGMATGRQVQSAVTATGMALAGASSDAVRLSDRALGPAGVGLSVLGEGLRASGEIERGEDPNGAVAAAGGRLVTNLNGAAIGGAIGTLVEPGLGTILGAGLGSLLTDQSGVSEGVGESMRGLATQEADAPVEEDCSVTLAGC